MELLYGNYALIFKDGGYEIADAQRLSSEERAKRNRIYDTFAL